jgi:hypothetical protein
LLAQGASMMYYGSAQDPLALINCRLSRLMSSSTSPQVPDDEAEKPIAAVERWEYHYKSRFERWEETAVVHGGHRLAPLDDSLLYFSRAVAPAFSHPEVRNSSEEVQRGLLVLSLFDWLEFTEWLEMVPVNDCCDLLRRAHFLPWLPAQMHTDALKIYTDEAGHAQMSHDLARAVEEQTGYESLRLRPPFLDVFDELVRAHDSQLEPLLILCFAIVSETLITGSLKKLPKDLEVQAAVREFASHHAQDEANHHHYFRELCEILWPRLPRELRRMIGPLLPRMVRTFLEPRFESTARILSQFPDSFPEPRRVAEEVLTDDVTADAIRTASRPTLRMFTACGVFDDQDVFDCFIDHGLQPPQSMLDERRAGRG